METPSSTRRITRSQTGALSASNNTNVLISRKMEDTEKKVTESRLSAEKNQQDRFALTDITNDSPIVGLAMGNLDTPLSAMSKNRRRNKAYTRTPGSGEALLRGQVKTLLQKVEEEALVSKITLEKRPFFNLQGLNNSPAITLLAPTPANTPQVGLPFVNENLLIPQIASEMLIDGKEEEGIESENLITRSLLLDFSEKSQPSDSSGSSSIVTCLGGAFESSREKLSTDDDGAASIWSIQVNTSSTKDDEEEEEFECYINEEYEYNDYEDEEEDYYYVDNYELVDDLCEGMSKVSVTKFTGKHIRFLYNSDDKIQGEQEVCNAAVTE